jgi:hypothetical protein
MKFKISVGEFESAEEPQIGPPQISDDVLQKYVEAVGDITTPTGTFHREKKLVFEQFLEKAKNYVESNGGSLEGESDDMRGFFKYTVPAIVHADTEDDISKSFWGDVFSQYRNYAITVKGDLVEICVYEEYYV